MKTTKQSGAPQICMRIIRAHLLRFFVSQGQPVASTFILYLSWPLSVYLALP